MARTYHHLVGGKQLASDHTFESRSSSNLADIVGIFPEASKEQVREACLVARNGFTAWSKTPAPIRGELIASVGRALEREKEPLSRLITREMGKTLKEARGSVQEAIDTCNFFQSEGRRLYGQTVPSEMLNKELTTYRRPLGVGHTERPRRDPDRAGVRRAIGRRSAGPELRPAARCRSRVPRGSCRCSRTCQISTSSKESAA